MSSPSMADYLPNLQFLIGTAVILALPTLYYMALPRVLPGIPYHKKSSRTIKGDVPAFIEHATRTAETCTFFARQCEILKAPLVQVFLQPFSKYPFLILSDHREVEDILTKRTQEFDRSTVTTVFFESVVPYGSIQMQSHDMFKAQRRLWAPTISPSFVNNAAASHVHANILDLMALWRRKAALAGDRAFKADDDIHYLTLDAIWAIALGDQLKGTEARQAVLTSPDVVRLASTPAEHVKFPDVEVAPVIRALENLLNSTDGIAKSPFPRLYQIFMRRRGWYRRDWAIKENTMARLIRDCRQAFNENTDPETPASSAMELVLKREHAQLLKSGGKRDPEDRGIKDELFTFLIAGNETATTTLSWFVKYIADNQEAQTRLREALQSQFPNASAEHPPSTEEFLSADVPYWDAAVAECLRVSRPAGAIVRQATVDTQILGHQVPAGTSIFCLLNGETYLYKDAITTDDDKRSNSSRGSAEKHHPWDFEGKQEFQPSRWLKSGPDCEVFDANAGPSLPFSAGPRGCFGKKLAWVELKMIVAFMIMSFEFKPLPKELNSSAAEEAITRKPKDCFVRLTPLP